MSASLLRDAGPIVPEWWALWQRSGAPPFRSPGWLLPWWDQFGTADARIATVRDASGALAGVLPLYRLDNRLLPWGAGVTDYQDALIAPYASADAASRLLAAALGFDTTPCDLIDLPPDSALAGAPPPAGWMAVQRDDGPCPVLVLADGVPAGQRRKLRMARHRADRIGGFTVDTATEATLPRLHAELARLHALRWRASGGEGVLSDPLVQRFHAGFAPLLLAHGALRLCVLCFGNRAAAAILALVSPGRLLLYLNGYDPDFAFQSPGTLLLGAMIEQAEAEQCAEIHFLRGAEPYKYAWGARDRRNVARSFVPA